MEAISIAVIAGGSSRRMGRDKGLIDVNGRPMARWVIDAAETGARAAGELRESIVISNSPGYEVLGRPVLPDIRPGLGPVAGIETALAHLRGDATIVIACDMPLLESALVTRLAHELRGNLAAIPDGPNGLEPCCAAYSSDCMRIVGDELDAGRLEARGLIEALRSAGSVATIDDLTDGELRGLENVNKAAEVERVIEILREA